MKSSIIHIMHDNARLNRNISFFYKKHFFHRDDRHLMRGSSLIRGEQIAVYLGAKRNPTSGYENDVCIFVKPHFNHYAGLPKNCYVDLLDSKYFIDKLLNRPDIKLIVSSLESFHFLKKILAKNNIVFIPQHHCNFERDRRAKIDMRVAGYIGSPSNFNCSIDEVLRRCKQLGISFIHNFHYKNRSQVCAFYKQIDIQLDWRSKSTASNPLKIVNACSFGIPTIAYPKPFYEEMDGYYLKAENFDDMFKTLGDMKNSPYVYDNYAEIGLLKAEEYHIEKIADLYRKLY